MGFDGEHIGQTVLTQVLKRKGVKLTRHKHHFDILTAREAWEVKTVGVDSMYHQMSVKASQKVAKRAWARAHNLKPRSMLIVINDGAKVYVKNGLGKFRSGGMKRVKTYKNWRKELGHGRIERLVEGRPDPRFKWMKDRGIELEKGLTIEDARGGFGQLERISDKVLKDVGAKGGRFRIITHPVTQEKEWAHLKGKIPRGWDGTGYTWDDVYGISNDITMGAIAPANSGGISIIRHEMGHKINRIEGHLIRQPEFEKIHQNLSKIPGLRSYYKQAGEAGRSETFASFVDGYYASKDEIAEAAYFGRIGSRDRWESLGTGITDRDMKPMIDWWEKFLGGLK